MQCVTAVDGHWLAELGPMFFTVKESRFVSLSALLVTVISVSVHLSLSTVCAVCENAQ